MTARAPSRKPTRAIDRERAKRLGGTGSKARRAKRVSKDEHERRGRQVIRQVMILASLSAATRGIGVRDLLQVVGDGTVRTLYRDLEQLQAAGFALANEGGLWTLETKLRITVPFTPDEAIALLVSSQAIGSSGAFASSLATLRAKVLASMSPTARAFCEELGETVVATTFTHATAGEPLVALAREAIAKDHALAITHAKPGQTPRRRVVDPYAIWVADGRTYLIARCRERDEMLHFHFSRISAAEVLDEAFDRDPRFELETYVASGFGAFRGPTHDIVIDLDGDVAHAARETRIHDSQELEERDGGGVRLRLHAGGLRRLAAWVAGFGGKARAVEPPELVDEVRALARGALGAHTS